MAVGGGNAAKKKTGEKKPFNHITWMSFNSSDTHATHNERQLVRISRKK